MERTFKVIRLYSLGKYKNIKVEDGFENIEKEVWMNPVSMKLLRHLTMIGVDSYYAQYINESGILNKQLNDPQALEAYLEELDESRLATLGLLREAEENINIE